MLAQLTEKDTSLVSLLRRKSQLHPTKSLYTFLLNGETKEICLTYQELDQKAQVIAALLQSFKARGERVLLLYPPGLEFIEAFFGCLYAGVIPVPAYPPRRNQRINRLLAIAQDAEARFVFAPTEVLDSLAMSGGQDLGLTHLHLIATDSIEIQQALNWIPIEINQDALAFLQYTSGSTGNPKGVKPVRWLKAISRYKATTSGGSDFAYKLCANKITAEQKENLDLSSWSVAFSGAEPVHSETLEQFYQAFKDCGFRRESFYPCYGLAEATLFVSGGLKTQAPMVYPVEGKSLAQNLVIEAIEGNQDIKKIVSCGQAWMDEKIIIVDPESLQECASGEVGEVWVSGSHIAQGYWGRSQATAETFQAHLQGVEGSFLRTGDLGFLHNGELFITGRRKDLIIILGRNHYPQDIETTVETAHLALRPNCGAAFIVEVKGQEHLVIAQEVERAYLRKLNIDEVVTSIRREVARGHSINAYHVVLLKTGSIPKTSSGKIQRHACKMGFVNDTLDILKDDSEITESNLVS